MNTRRYLTFLLALTVAACLTEHLHAQKPSLNVVDFGAIGDGKTINTRALQAAIDTCEKRGGGAIVIPAGKFLTGTLILKSHLRIHIEAGGELIGSPNIRDYNAAHRHLLYGKQIQNFSITGKGIINGNGNTFFDDNFNPLDRPAPFVVLEDAEDISIKDIKLENSPAHCLVLSGCNRVVVDGITILNHMRSPNTDGIDITSSSNVMISNCFISTGDDAICLKTYHPESDKGDDIAVPTSRHSTKPTENVTVTNCIIESDDGALKLGTGSGTAIRYCSFNNIIIRNSRFGIALFMKDGGVYEHLHFSNIYIQTASRHATEYPIFIDIEKRDNSGNYGTIRHVRFSGIDMHTRGNCLIAGQKDSPLYDFTFENLSLHIIAGVDVSNFKKPRGNKRLGEIAGSSDFANIHAHLTIGHAEQLTLKNISVVSSTDTHPRHAVGIFSSREVQISELTYQTHTSLASVLVTQSENITLERCRSLFSPLIKIEGDIQGSLYLLDNRVKSKKSALQLPRPGTHARIVEHNTLETNN
jgi:hypothetical protein